MLATAATVAGIFIWGRLEDAAADRRLAAYIATLSQTAYLDIAGTQIVLPLAAIDDYGRSGHMFTLDPDAAAADIEAGRKKFRDASANPDAPFPVPRVTLLIETWGWDDFGHHDLYQAICPKLAREWARSVCDNPWSALQQSLPTHFDLADPSKIELYNRNGFAGGRHTAADHLKAMRLSPGQTQIACDPDRMATGQNLCTAARLVRGNLLAIWTVDHDASDEDLQRTGDAMAALVEFGLGEEERFDQLILRACNARRSNHAKPFNDEDKDCPGD